MSSTAPTSATAHRWARDALFNLAGIFTGTLAIVLWSVGVWTSVAVAITYFGLLLALGTLLSLRWLARVERRRAAIVLGAPIPEPYHAPLAGRWNARLYALLGQPATWREFAYAALAGWFSLMLASTALALWAGVVGLIAMPAWYWSLPGDIPPGVDGGDALALSFAATALGFVLIPVCGYAVRGLTIVQVQLMRLLLSPRADEGEVSAGAAAAAQAGTMPPRPARPAGAGLPLHVAFALLLGLVVTIIWVAVGGGYFWPVWTWLGLAISVGLHWAIARGVAAASPEERFRAKVELCAVIAAVCLAIWALTGAGYLWPIWPVLGMATVLAVRGLFVFRERVPLLRERALVERVDVLTRTRQGALDVQAAELRRIERDLHDGAQARLVALTMQLGRAEEKLADRPEVAALVKRAREDAGAAIAELRDLARGIAPPILADRGLAAAIEALGRRSAIGVTVDADPDRRPLPVIETAAYFVVAEALTNVAKHAGGASAHVTVGLAEQELVIEIVDDGPGGADPAGGGLTGLRHRVEALDGTLKVVSPRGGGTTIRAELPCGW